MANSKRYQGITRAQQRRRNNSVFRKMTASGYNVNSNEWNTLAGRATERWRRLGYTGTTERITKEYAPLFGGRQGVSGNFANVGEALYPDQARNANSRASYRRVRAAFGLSAG